jgi:hypothetical protein
MAGEAGLKVDREEFKKCQEHARQVSQAAASGDKADLQLDGIDSFCFFFFFC